MLEHKNYQFYNNQIIFTILLSLIPGLVFTILAWMNQIATGALLWFSLLVMVSIWGLVLKYRYESKAMDSSQLPAWYEKIRIFYYSVFSLWTLIFILYAGEVKSNLHYIVIFTQVGLAVIASALLVTDRKIYVPILLILLLPLSLYFFYIDTLYGYVLAVFNMVLLAVLLYASNNTYELIRDNDYQAKHDMLTGLYNRRYFLNHMESLISRLDKSKKVAYLLLIDLDNFKIINDSLGHDIGDKVLQSVARRIQNFTEDKYSISRFGGDEFTLLSLEYNEHEYTSGDVYTLAEELLIILKEPYRIQQHRLHLSASIGIKQITGASSDGNEFIKEADIAMYEAKDAGRDCIVVFNEALAKSVQKHHEIEQKLYFAFKDKAIELYYQPLFNKHKVMIGSEALVRWKEGDTYIAPDIFIPLAEKTGLIIDLGYYLLEEGFKTLVHWHNEGMKIEHFAINISVKQLLVSTFPDHVGMLCDQYLSQNLREKVYFEVTESVLAGDVHRTIENMENIKSLGIRFSMDDFGTGYSSLSHLKELPIDEIKIDKSFVSYLSEEDLDHTMVPAILSIAKLFDLSVVAEGVETEEQFDFLVAQGCDVFQGYYFNKAVSKIDFLSLYTS
jgi:diguanylate cyclase (GGDEF)-like protein